VSTPLRAAANRDAGCILSGQTVEAFWHLEESLGLPAQAVRLAENFRRQLGVVGRQHDALAILVPYDRSAQCSGVACLESKTSSVKV